jgi:hypothetical protein
MDVGGGHRWIRASGELMQLRHRDPESIRQAASRGGPDGDDPYTGLSWWWMLAPTGLALAVAAFVFVDTLVAVAVIGVIVVLGGLALFSDEWLGDDWT